MAVNEDSFERVIRVLNELQDKHLITSYAIGGGFASIFYTEPFFTEDVDIFILVPLERENSIDYLRDVYRYLKSKGYSEEGPYMRIEGILVQFFAASDPPLFRAAVENALDISFGETPARILSAEYLIALMLLASRPKDLLRINQILDQKLDLDRPKLDAIIKQNELSEKWARLAKSR